LNTKKQVKAGIVIIGNEILSGRTQDTNVSHLALVLNEWGITIAETRIIPDIESVIIDTVRHFSTSFEYVFTTGGIGPTHDDITAACIAKAFNKPLIEHPQIAKLIRSRPTSDEVMKSRLLMAQVPEGSGLIDNPTGGPQGFFIENVYVMAGIPKVMQAMLSTLGGQLTGGLKILSCSVTAYLGESQIASELGKLQNQFPGVDIGSYPFTRNSRYGTSLVFRSTSAALLPTVLDEACKLIERAGGTPEDIHH
jgi:molybdenum cofactor synthesis domain-containing protein